MLVILAAEIAGGVLGYVTKDEVVGTLKKEAKEYFQMKYKNSSDSDADKAWNSVMKKVIITVLLSQLAVCVDVIDDKVSQLHIICSVDASNYNYEQERKLLHRNLS